MDVIIYTVFIYYLPLLFRNNFDKTQNQRQHITNLKQVRIFKIYGIFENRRNFI